MNHCGNQLPVLFLFMAHHQSVNMSKTTGATSEAGTSYPCGVSEFTSGFVFFVFLLFFFCFFFFCRVRVPQSVFWVVFCGSLFVLFVFSICIFLVLSRCTASNYPFSIFELFLSYCYHGMCFCYAHRRLCIVSSRHGRPDRMEWKTAINVLLFYLVLGHTMRFSLVFVFPIINCYLSLFIPQFTIDNSKRPCNQLWASPVLFRLSWLLFLFCHATSNWYFTFVWPASMFLLMDLKHCLDSQYNLQNDENSEITAK